MKTFIISIILSLVCGIAYAKPHCQGFNNYDNKTTIVFTDDKAGSQYAVSDVILIPSWKGKEYKATSVRTTVENGVATVGIFS